MTLPTTRSRTIARIHFHPAEAAPGLYEQLLDVLHGISPLVEPHPADWSATVDLTGALPYWRMDAADLTALIRLRLLALHGVPSSAGTGCTRMIATMAAATTPPGHTTIIGSTPYDIHAFLRPQPTAALPGIGPATARTLTRYGIHTIGDIADTPTATLQRILGTAAARQAHARAHGIDPRPVIPTALPKSASATHHFTRDTLDPAEHRRAILALANHLGQRLRTNGEATGALALMVRYADRSSTSRSRVLPEATHHSHLLVSAAYDIHASLALQRARVTAFSLRAEALRPIEQAARQLTFDPADERTIALEAAADRARARFGPGIIKPAALAPAPARTGPRAVSSPVPAG
ncbi:hypothetical protein ACFY1P_20205 [Streptomyces sp. NPDC001407]|uniref:DNA polymerase Y family protein n=1 Tax=Streptomyces sp. NPDC001407 TaxID=3364573 RepID=UPI0036AA65F0